jgi:hypothetical protein
MQLGVGDEFQVRQLYRETAVGWCGGRTAGTLRLRLTKTRGGRLRGFLDRGRQFP